MELNRHQRNCLRMDLDVISFQLSLGYCSYLLVTAVSIMYFLYLTFFFSTILPTPRLRTILIIFHFITVCAKCIFSLNAWHIRLLTVIAFI